jgi:hypothetical protein
MPNSHQEHDVHDQLKQEKAKNRMLRELIRHCWVHSGYRDCGYVHMSTEQKILYNHVIGRRSKEAI